jgi:Nif-specific regulatory protein
VDVRLVAATNRDLEQAVARGEFRADLYYRISVVPIMLAPLRERREDIPLLAREFLKRYNETHGTAMSISDEAVNVLTSCDFPGNVRELESCVSRTAAFAKGTRIVADDFACRNDSCLSSVLSRAITERNNRNGYIPLPVAMTPPRPRPVAPRPSPPLSPTPDAADNELSGSADEQSMPGFEGASDDASEREHLIEAMEKAGWVQAKAARLLGVTPRQMGYALRKHDIPIKRF